MKIVLIIISIISITALVMACIAFSKTFKNNRESYSDKKPKIAIYSYNFGSYRGELNGGIDNMTFYPEFDYYFYTNNDIKSDKWKVIKVPLQPRTKHMNANRVTVKYYKFKKLPEELLNYDYVLHIDNSGIKGSRGGMTRFTPQKINDLIQKNKNVAFFGRRQPVHKNIIEECGSNWHTGEHENTEYRDAADAWVELLKKENFEQKFPHTELCIFLRKVNDQDLNRIMPKVFDKLMERGLCRDQHVFSYILQEEDFPKEKFLIVDWF